MRAGGMSVWQFLRPGLLVALLLGVFDGRRSSTRWRRPAATAAESLFAEAFGKESNLLALQLGGSWLRQDGADGQSVISAALASNRGLTLTGVTVFVFDREGHFVERVDGGPRRPARGYLGDPAMPGSSRLGREPEKFDTYLLVHIPYTGPRARMRSARVFSVSFWELPGLIEVAEKAKLSIRSAAHPVRGAAVPPAAVRGDGPFGGNCVVAVIPLWGHPDYGHRQEWWGVSASFLLSEVSRQIGVAGLGASVGGDLVARGPRHCCLGYGAVAPGGWLSDASTRTPQEGCGSSRVPCRRRKAAGRVRLAVFACSCCAASSLGARRAHAQDPSIARAERPEVDVRSPSRQHVRPVAQHRQVAAALSAGRRARSTTPGGNRVIARGNVEIYYNNYILTADEVVYDQSRQHADGRRQRRAQGAQRQHRPRRPLHADRRFPRRLRAVAVSIVATRRHAHHRRARDAPRRQHTEFTNGRFTPCKSDDGMPPLVVHQRRDASSTISRPRPSPTRMRSSRCSACRSSTCPTSSTPIRR